MSYYAHDTLTYPDGSTKALRLSGPLDLEQALRVAALCHEDGHLRDAEGNVTHNHEEVKRHHVNREEAREFLKRLRVRLNAEISQVAVRSWLAEYAGANHEGDFLNQFVLPPISRFLEKELSSPDRASKALLAESAEAKGKLKIASASPASAQKHLFTKVLGVPARTLVNLWWGTGAKKPFSQSCPDWAFRDPSKHKIVFEAKLFRSGGLEAAKTELVKGIYQCFYYRGQPKIPPAGRRPGWDYEYACLFAYDASDSGSLVKAWEPVAKRVGDDCWSASNIFVMVLPARSAGKT